MKKILFILFIFLVSNIRCKKSFLLFEDECNCNARNHTINLNFRYGVRAQNILNTYDCTYTKDMIIDPSITTCLKLTTQEIDSIHSKMTQINFFNYPDTYHIKQLSDTVEIISPYSSYYFNVESDELTKRLYWEDEIVASDHDADQLRELINLIIGLIQSKDEYKNLPEAKGGYL